MLNVAIIGYAHFSACLHCSHARHAAVRHVAQTPGPISPANCTLGETSALVLYPLANASLPVDVRDAAGNRSVRTSDLWVRVNSRSAEVSY